MMKKIIYLLCVVPILGYSQVIIGKGKTTLTNLSVSLEFGTEPKGLALPMVTSAVNTDAAGAVPGTLVFDTSDMKMKLKLSNQWYDYTVDTTGTADLTIQNNYSELQGAKVAIGTLSQTPGILVLEDFDKAMILPLVNTYKDIQSPTSGLIVFDTTLKLLCTYNGTVWSFWKAS